MLAMSKLSYRIAGRPIFENASATIQPGWKVGVVGPNGAGKSTLFKLISGELQLDAGEISLADRFSLGLVRQDIADPNQGLLDAVLAADTERTQLLAQCETEQNGDKLGEIFERLNDIDAYAAPARASAVLAGLGFKEHQLQQPLKDFSGGWQMRVALAGALFRQPDFLLLDEPTNHLDLEAIMWLEEYLASYPKTLLIISHDRDLLNKCTDHILHVEKQQLNAYTGNYDTFEKERAERLMNQQKLHEKQTAQRAHMQAFVDRFKAKASKARQAQSRLKALEKMSVVDAVMADRSIKFTFPQPETLNPPMLTFEGVDLGYGKAPPVLKNLTQQLEPDDRIALLGANGNGKSTLMKLFAGKLEPLAGKLRAHGKLRIGYFAQHQTDELDVSETPYQAMARALGTGSETEVRGKLGRFGFSKPLTDNRIGTLSGGEKARLLFAMMTVHSPHLLLLDEPTNHLDMDAREALVQALNQYDGAVVIVSHDPSMVERVADSLWLVENGQVQPFEGDLLAYRAHIVAQRRAERRKEGKTKASSGALSDAEKRVAQLEREVRASEKAMLKTDFLTKPTAKQAAATQAHAELVAALAAAEETYLALLEATEQR
jgi:ATP-binding cassette subfamily F protein 3